MKFLFDEFWVDIKTDILKSLPNFVSILNSSAVELVAVIRRLPDGVSNPVIFYNK